MAGDVAGDHWGACNVGGFSLIGEITTKTPRFWMPADLRGPKLGLIVGRLASAVLETTPDTKVGYRRSAAAGAGCKALERNA